MTGSFVNGLHYPCVERGKIDTFDASRRYVSEDSQVVPWARDAASRWS